VTIPIHDRMSFSLGHLMGNCGIATLMGAKRPEVNALALVCFLAIASVHPIAGCDLYGAFSHQNFQEPDPI
jgi:hypothetical protein